MKITDDRKPGKESRSMEGKTVVVTGANRGLGREITRELVRHHARVIMACRSFDHAIQVSREIKRENDDTELEVRYLDLADASTIREFAHKLSTEHAKIDALINNAGVTKKSLERLANGLEATLAINVLGPHLLIHLLKDLLKAAGGARIINVASDFAGELDLDDLNFESRKYKETKAYKQSKQANRMLSREWARRLEADHIWVNAMAPGLMTGTDLFRHAGRGETFFMRQLGRMFGVSVEEGADTAIWLTCESHLEGRSGGYYRKRRKIKCKFEDTDKERILWERCDALLIGT